MPADCPGDDLTQAAVDCGSRRAVLLPKWRMYDRRDRRQLHTIPAMSSLYCENRSSETLRDEGLTVEAISVICTGSGGVTW